MSTLPRFINTAEWHTRCCKVGVNILIRFFPCHFRASLACNWRKIVGEVRGIRIRVLGRYIVDLIFCVNLCQLIYEDNLFYLHQNSQRGETVCYYCRNFVRSSTRNWSHHCYRMWSVHIRSQCEVIISKGIFCRTCALQPVDDVQDELALVMTGVETKAWYGLLAA